MIDVRALSLRSFMSHAGTDLELPDRGVVLVTGDNGAGKSTLIEAVSVALWGRTLRGTKPWQDGKGSVEVAANAPHALYATRRCAGGRVSLDWNWDGGAPVEYETTTKAQEALEAVVGSWEVWRRTSVFSSQDAAHFSLATDAERKRLLEAILQIDRFDAALEAARKDATTAARTHADAARQLAAAQARYTAQDEEKARLASEMLTMTACHEDSPERLQGEAANYRDLYEATQRDLAHVERRLRELAATIGEQRAYLRRLEERSKLLSQQSCPTCSQAIGPAARRVFEEDLAEAQRTTAAEYDAVKGEIDGLEAQVAELRTERLAFGTCLQAVERELARAQNEVTNRRRLAARLSGLHAEMEHTFVGMSLAQSKQEDAAHQTAVLDTVVQVLGLKGVRATILGRALSGIEGVANHWLSRVAGPGLRLALCPYTERKGGGTAEAIDLRVEGAGGGHGYRAASGGERRRIDVALLLALAEVASASVGKRPGTLWFDEVFDALDATGVHAVVQVLDELAQDRAVVVISHSTTLSAALRPVERWSVGGGKVRTT